MEGHGSSALPGQLPALLPRHFYASIDVGREVDQSDALLATAMLILWLALAGGGLLAGSGYVHARDGHSRWRALAECGVAKGADYERKCRRFSRTERSTWRAYDGPGAGAPRDWEIPRPYD